MTYNLTKVDRFARIMQEQTTVPVAEICSVLDVKRPNVYKMIQSSPSLAHLVIDKGMVVNRLRKQFAVMHDVPEYVYNVIHKDSTGFTRLAMNWNSLDLEIVDSALRNEQFTIEALDDLTDSHVCSIIRMLMFYLLERKGK